jgi:glycosyltransferase involved in cell wall biosynthesis
MRIVFVHRAVSTERVGGTYTYIHDLGRRLVERGHEIHIVASARSAETPPFTVLDGLSVHRYAFHRLNPVLSTLQHLVHTYRAFASIADKGPVDVLSINDSHLGYGLARSRLGRASCQIPTYHAPSFLEYRFNTAWQARAERNPVRRAALRLAAPPLARWQRRFEAGVLDSAQGILVLSRYTLGHIERYHPHVDPGKVRVIPSGVDIKRFRPAEDKAAVRKSLGIDGRATVLLTVRNLSPRMGLENLIEAMATIAGTRAAREANLALLICGDGRLRGALEEMVRVRGLTGVVKLLGRVPHDDLPRCYQAADLFVLPTEAMEGFGIVTIEALASGIPVLGTPAGATPEIIGPIDPRLLTRDTSPSAIADGILSWLGWRSEDADASRYRREAEQKYAWDRVTGEVERFYEETVRAFRRS